MANLAVCLDEMKEICSRKGSHYFDADTVRFWGAKILDTPNKWGLFIERYDNFDRSRKLYAVKFFGPDGFITSVEPKEQGETYEHFSSYEQAKQFRHKMTIALNQAAKNYREAEVLETLCEVQEEGLHTGIYILRNSNGDSIKVNTNNFSRFVCG